MSLVFFCQEEPDKLRVGHLPFLLGRSAGHGAREYPVNHPGADC